MNKPARFLTLLALGAFAAFSAGAAEEDTVRVQANDANGNPLAVVPVSLDSKITFTSGGMEIHDKDKRTAAWSYGQVATLSFITPGNVGVADIEASSTLRLLSNPVGDMLEISGFDGERSPLVVTSLQGAVCVSIPEWDGTPVDVSSLSSGLYFVTVNRTTLKFIKK